MFFESIWKIEKTVLETVDFSQAAKQVVNIVFTELGYNNYGYQAIVLTLLDEEKKVLRRIAISNTEDAEKFLRETPIPFNDIIIPLWAEQNLSVRAINERKMFVTENVAEIFIPAVDREWVDQFQMVLKTKTAIVYPVIAKDKILGALIFTLTKSESEMKEVEWQILESFVGAVGIALDNALLFKSVKDQEESLKVANERLKELDKMKDEFLSIASHELRTPMTIVKDYVSVMLNDKGISQENREMLEKVFVSTQRLIALVNDNLDVSKIESGTMQFEPTEFDISKLAFEVKDELTEKYTKKKQKVEVQVGNYNVKADRNKIHQVLMNLIDNAIKYSPDNGLIEVTFMQIENTLVTTIFDNGSGIKPENMSKLFQKFERVGDANTQQTIIGTGLGLYLCKMIVEKSGGEIRAESEEGKGTKFIFTLPAV